jgi:hypothetical protein
MLLPRTDSPPADERSFLQAAAVPSEMPGRAQRPEDWARKADLRLSQGGVEVVKHDPDMLSDQPALLRVPAGRGDSGVVRPAAFTAIQPHLHGPAMPHC